MRIDRVTLRLVRLPLVRAFETSSSRKEHLDHILIQVQSSDGITGWGECASPSGPFYCGETTETCWHIVHDFLIPMILGQEWTTIQQLAGLYANVKGNAFARAGVEMACWDALAREQSKPLHALLGGTRREIFSGVSLGIEPNIDTLCERIDQFLEEGYRRIKLKIGPGHDIEVVRRVRERFPEIPLQVDANAAYRPEDESLLRELDAFNLILIEQPLADDDIMGHAHLQSILQTPICLDESICSAAQARQALELKACQVINIKVSRLGGLLEALRVHDLCLARGIPVWCGGMHEFGIGRAANLAIASLPGFTIPGDVSGSDKYYRQDVVEPPILAKRGAIALRDRPGLGVEPVLDIVQTNTLREAVLTSALGK
jgi:O-succinylbenzoate synthase